MTSSSNNKLKAKDVSSLTKEQKRKLQAFSRPDEWMATIGVLSMLFTVVVAVRFPAHYWLWHLARSSYYLPTRYIRFKKKRWHYYLLDWCYVVTYLSSTCTVLAFLRVAFGISTPLRAFNATLIRAGFAMACGPLAISVFVFRNSIVLHDVDHLASVFIHLSPFCLFWCMRWGSGTPSIIDTSFPNMFHVCETSADFAAADECLRTIKGMFWCTACYAPLSAFVVPPAVVYLSVWAVPYFLAVFVWWRDWLEETGHDTLYHFFCQTHANGMEKFAGKVRPVFGDRYAKPVAYMLLHFVAMTTFCSFSYLLWHSFVLHSIMLVAVLAKAVHNGNTYMFRAFPYRYVNDLLAEHGDKLE